MSTTVTGTPYKLGQRFVAKVEAASEQYEPANAVDAVYVLAADCIIALPSAPQVDQTLTIVATDFPVEVVSNFPIAAGGDAVANGTATEYLFAPNFEWIILATGTGVGSGSAPPENSFQLAGPGNTFAASTLTEPAPGWYSAPDFSFATVLDDVTEDTLILWEKGSNGAGSDEFPPGSTLNFGTNNAGTAQSQPDNVYYWGGQISFLGVGPAPYGDPDKGAAIAFRVGTRFSSVLEPLEFAGVHLSPNVMIITEGDLLPTNEMVGGGSGVVFQQSANVVPTLGTSTEVGLISFVHPDDARPYGLPFGATQPIALYAGPTILTFGAGSIGTGTTPISLYPGFSTAAGQASLIEIPMPSTALDVVGMSVHQTPEVGADGTIIGYQLYANEVAVVGALVTVLDTGELTTLTFGAPIEIPVSATLGVFAVFSDGTLGASPTNIVVSVTFLPHYPT